MIRQRTIGKTGIIDITERTIALTAKQNMNEMLGVIRNLLKAGCARIVINLTNITEIDHGSADDFVEVQNLHPATRFAFYGLNQSLVISLNRTRFNNWFRMHRSEKEALMSISSSMKKA